MILRRLVVGNPITRTSRPHLHPAVLLIVGQLGLCPLLLDPLLHRKGACVRAMVCACGAAVRAFRGE